MLSCLLSSYPAYNSAIQLDQDVELKNNKMLITLEVNPNLNLTSNLIVDPYDIKFDGRWWNITHAAGIVDANVTYWSPASGVKCITWLVNNSTLTATHVWFNGTRPYTVYLDDVVNIGDWYYLDGVTKINAASAVNITAYWLYVPPAGVETGVSYSSSIWLLPIILIPILLAIVFTRRSR